MSDLLERFREEVVAQKAEIERLKLKVEAYKRYRVENRRLEAEIERLRAENDAHIKANGKLVSQCAKLQAVVDAAENAIKFPSYFPAMQGLREALAALKGEK